MIAFQNDPFSFRYPADTWSIPSNYQNNPNVTKYLTQIDLNINFQLMAAKNIIESATHFIICLTQFFYRKYDESIVMS